MDDRCLDMLAHGGGSKMITGPARRRMRQEYGMISICNMPQLSGMTEQHYRPIKGARRRNQPCIMKEQRISIGEGAVQLPAEQRTGCQMKPDQCCRHGDERDCFDPGKTVKGNRIRRQHYGVMMPALAKRPRIGLQCGGDAALFAVGCDRENHRHQLSASMWGIYHWQCDCQLKHWASATFPVAGPRQPVR